MLACFLFIVVTTAVLHLHVPVQMALLVVECWLNLALPCLWAASANVSGVILLWSPLVLQASSGGGRS
jgi:hypothetical protein